jgi:hypothetical protein
VKWVRRTIICSEFGKPWNWRAIGFRAPKRLTSPILLITASLAEAMRTRAWIIIDDVKLFPGEVVTAVRELASGLVDEICMPPDLDSHVESIDG